MREIKFRAWDKSKGHMVIPTINHSGFNLNELLSSIEDDELKLMQYTGLKDRNGVEIYEGDIVKFRDCCGITLTKKVEWVEKDAGFYPFGADYGCGDTVGTDHAVIGNIYEHSELLK